MLNLLVISEHLSFTKLFGKEIYVDPSDTLNSIIQHKILNLIEISPISYTKLLQGSPSYILFLLVLPRSTSLTFFRNNTSEICFGSVRMGSGLGTSIKSTVTIEIIPN